MSESDLDKGRAMRRRLLGDAYVDGVAAKTYSDPLMKKFIDLAAETVFGVLWTRPGLDLKTRTLVTVISDASLLPSNNFVSFDCPAVRNIAFIS